MKRLILVGVAAVSALGLITACGVSTTNSADGSRPATTLSAPAGAPLTNLSHLNFLMDSVPLKPLAGHTTYQLAEHPTAQAPWTYADKTADGYRRMGGGSLDPATGYWSQGAYNADDIARTAVVYLRHWQQTGASASRDYAFQTLRSLTYLQTDEGPNAGNVVLWQQADGTLTPSAKPVELPDPSDSAESFWLARTVWALGEGYAAFKTTDPAFASFLQERMHLSLSSLQRQSLSKYGKYDVVHGVKVPAWLIVNEADDSAEAVLGLAAYVKAAPKDAVATTALTQLSKGIAVMSSGSMNQWPFGAILPQNNSRSLWHAWAGMAPAALARASTAIGQDDWRAAAVKDVAQFTPQLLAAGGPDNEWAPMPGGSQIAYGVDSRVQGLVDTAAAANAPGLLDVAAVTAGWFFGANPAGTPAYNRDNGAAVDGIEPDGRVNQNSGAESTIHALLTMLALDANPKLKANALGINKTVATHGLSVVEAESGTIAGGGSVVKPASAWTGEANWSGGAYVALKAGATLTIPVPADSQDRNVYPVVNQSLARAGTTIWSAEKTSLGSTPNGGAGTQGIAPVPDMLFPFALKRPLPTGSVTVVGKTDGTVSVDALLLSPLISTVYVTGPGGDLTLYISSVEKTTVRNVDVPSGFVLTQQAYDARGKPVGAGGDGKGADQASTVTVAAGGFTVARLVKK